MRITNSGRWPVHVFVDSTISFFVKSLQIGCKQEPFDKYQCRNS